MLRSDFSTPPFYYSEGWQFYQIHLRDEFLTQKGTPIKITYSKPKRADFEPFGDVPVWADNLEQPQKRLTET